MIIPDVNLLVYAYNQGCPQHPAAKKWLEDCFNSDQFVGLSWSVILGFSRLMCNRKVLEVPITAAQALEVAQQWLQLHNVGVVEPTEDHLPTVQRFMQESSGGTKLIMDAHLASIAFLVNGTVYSNDTDFSRFQGVRWKNPL